MKIQRENVLLESWIGQDEYFRIKLKPYINKFCVKTYAFLDLNQRELDELYEILKELKGET